MTISCITNNPLVIEQQKSFVEAIDGSTLELFYHVKHKVIEGYILLTHPLSGSIGPDKSPYKSVVLKKENGKLDLESLNTIEKAIEYTTSLILNQKPLDWDEEILNDFAYIDFEFVKAFFYE